jgi:hypothetical protein
MMSAGSECRTLLLGSPKGRLTSKGGQGQCAIDYPVGPMYRTPVHFYMY